ncbi:S8 family serine peptidase [Aeromicrobium stalagmiti]|uniref:S8 family serine peptidase n=1 Tax=Aeromicrobium stalagmiti TaxID=2738988 RepID=UPI0015698536|nr:S8 family serine peptidase [Aeromicrobium stalagmiti]NRQ48419.1 S8 family serine peptidase [Aeromicrobium stalagmiti]
MSHPRVTRRRAGATVGIIGAFLAASITPGSAATTDDPKAKVQKAPAADAQTEPAKEVRSGDKLGQHDRELLAKAESKGTKRVTVMLATDRKATQPVVASLESAGAWVGMVNDKVGYVRASVPTGSVDKVSKLSAVTAVDLDESVKVDPPPATKSGAAAAAVAAPGAKTPDSNPYMPTRDIGSVAFKKAHPKWDGRGVTIGVIDSGVDLDHPALQETTTGERKIVDWVTATDPVLDSDATWRAMITEVDAAPTFTYAEATWTAPVEGTFTVSRFSENITAASEPGGDVNRDGDTTDQFGVLYDAETNDIWVDADQDKTFTDAEKIAPYAERFDVGHFGTDDPGTDIVESSPFVVEYREDVSLAPYGLPGDADFVNIGLVEDAHGSHVAGITAANSMFGGAMDGQAPGAQIVSSRACTWGGGCTNAALLDGMVDLVTNRGVDVVNMSIGGLPALNDANNARARIYDRLIADYGVQLFISGGNSGAGVNTIGDPSVATDVVSVASSITKETWLSNYGSVVSSAINLHTFSSRGPTESGGFKPNISAPGSAVSTVPRWLKQPDLAEAGYTLPVGYAMFNGTSMASPQAAGGAALLLSASSASDLPVTPRKLRDALYSSADRIPSVQSIAQGTGQMDVPGAWSLLNKAGNGRTFKVTAPVCSPLSGLLATPQQGSGIYNRCPAGAGGQKLNTAKAYKLKVTRTSGKTGSIRHNLRIVGNDGTFSVAKSISFTRGSTKTINVTAKAKTAGLHSAILEIDDPASPVVDHRVMLTVVQSTAFTEPSFSQTSTGEAQRNLASSRFVTVPEGTKALQVNLTGIATKSQTRFIAINPYGVPVDPTATTACYTNYSDPSVCKPTSRSYADPIPGVWEIVTESRRTSPFLKNPYTLKAAIQGVTVDPASQTLESVTTGAATPLEWDVKNDFGPVTIKPTGGDLGSALSERKTIGDGDSQEFEVEVPEGASTFTATIGRTADASADLDLTIYDAEGAVAGQSADGDSEESVTLDAPAAGTYSVVVDGYSVPAGSTEYDYLDVFYSGGLGTLDVAGTEVELARGATVKITGALTAETAPEEGRRLFGELRVLSGEGAVLGTGSVTVGGVTAE